MLMGWVILTLIQGGLFAYDDESLPAPGQEAGLFPDRIVLTWAGDPATTQDVTWRTLPGSEDAFGEIALADEGPQSAEAMRVAAVSQSLETDQGDSLYHTVSFTGLLPDTLYAYRVGNMSHRSEWMHFRTASAQAAPFSFLYFGDAQNEVRMHWSRVVREAVLHGTDLRFTLHAGDLINRAQRDIEWGEWFNAPGWVNGRIPVVGTPGNHEFYRKGEGPEEERFWTAADGSVFPVLILKTIESETGYQVWIRDWEDSDHEILLDEEENILAVPAPLLDKLGYTLQDLAGQEADDGPLDDRRRVEGERTLSEHWRPQFSFPLNGPEGLEETVYYFDYQGVRFVSLNSTKHQDVQAVWLDKVLAENPHPWVILTFHHPIFSPAKDRDNPQLRSLWKPVFDKYRVDLVLCGHDHTYARTGVHPDELVGSTNVPEGYQQAYDPEIGTVYVISVSGPKMYNLTRTDWAVRKAEDTQLFQIVSVFGDRLEFEARTATGRLYDAFTLRKRPGQPNELIEMPGKERRR